jgi:N-acetylglucosaminyldiphosphoundecaprenol N-acetyl-beta-D-mannosaminyltransferase
MLQKKIILGVDITDGTKTEVLEYIFNKLQKAAGKFYIVTPNPEILVYASKHPDYKKILNIAEIALPDGMGIVLAGKIMAKSFIERISGTDFMDLVCREGARKHVRIGLLGGRAGIAERAADCLISKYPALDIVFVSDQWGQEGFDLAKKYQVASSKYKVDNNIIHTTNYLLPTTKIDILFVAFGHPKQEEWIVANLDRLPVKAAMGVGGAFDYISGQIPRAPKIIRKIGFEWLYRLVREPWRLRRQLALIEFCLLVLKERFKVS